MDEAGVDDLRVELENQLNEQRLSLADIDEALAAGGSAELHQLREDLLEAIQQLEEALTGIGADTGAVKSIPDDLEAQGCGPSASAGQGVGLPAGCRCRYVGDPYTGYAGCKWSYVSAGHEPSTSRLAQSVGEQPCALHHLPCLQIQVHRWPVVLRCCLFTGAG
jgi:hypothetical protein